MAGQQYAYGRVMDRDDRVRRAAKEATEFHKYAATSNLSSKDKQELANRKRRSAVMSQFTGATGLGAFGATVGGMALKRPKAAAAVRRMGKDPEKVAHHLGRVQVPLLTAGAGVGGYNALTGAKIQRKEADTIKKGVSFRIRKPVMRRGFIRSVRTPGGAVKTSTVRGGLA